MNGTETSLEAEMIKRLKEWLKREAPRVRDQDVNASITFAISNPCADEDNTLVLGLYVQEKSDTRLNSDEHCLRVDGLNMFAIDDGEES